MNTIDLHNHTIASLDGSYTPKELVDIALDNHIKYFAIADHDYVSSISEAIEYAKNKDITIIPAIEISAIIDDTPLHILGYGIDYTNPKFEERRQFVRSKIKDWQYKAIQKARDAGFKFEDDVLFSYRNDGLICEELIGQAILNDPRNDNDERLKEYRNGGKLSDNPTFNFYKEFYATNKPFWIPYSFNMDIKEASELIHSTGGLMFLAHPKHNIGLNEEMFNKIVSYGLDGVEAFSSYHDETATKFYLKLAQKNNLLVSVGSDFHGRSKPAIKMGSINYDKEELDRTINAILKK